MCPIPGSTASPDVALFRQRSEPLVGLDVRVLDDVNFLAVTVVYQRLEVLAAVVRVGLFDVVAVALLSLHSDPLAAPVIRGQLGDILAAADRVVLAAAGAGHALRGAPEAVEEDDLRLFFRGFDEDMRPVELLPAARVHVPEVCPHVDYLFCVAIGPSAPRRDPPKSVSCECGRVSRCFRRLGPSWAHLDPPSEV